MIAMQKEDKLFTKGFTMTRFIPWFRLFLLIFAFSSANKIQAMTLTEVLEEHPNPLFIELTAGTNNGIKHAIEAGFKNIYATYVSQYLYEDALNEYGTNPDVHLMIGDPIATFNQLLTTLNQRATILFDANNNSLLLAQLIMLSSSAFKNNTIIIDDVQLLNEADLISIKKQIREINPKYDFVFEYIRHAKSVLLVANTSSHH